MDETPSYMPPVQPQPAPSKKKSPKGLIVAVLMLLIGIAAGAVGYKYLVPAKNQPATNNTSPTMGVQQQAPQSITASQLISAAKAQVKGTLAITKVDQYGDFLGGTQAYTVAPARVNNYKFYTLPRAQDIVGLAEDTTDQNTVQSDYEAVLNVFIQKGLTTTGPSYDSNNGPTVDFYGGGVHCRVQQQQDGQKASLTHFGAVCVDDSSYATNSQIIEPMYEALASTKPDQVKSASLLLSGSGITASKTAGYQTASVGQGDVFALAGGSAALFYQTPDKNWHYFLNTQSELSCDQYNTSDLRKAYLGQTCYDTALNKDSTVSL